MGAKKYKKPQGEPSPVQRLILAVLKKQGMTRYELGRKCGWTSSAVYSRLERPTLHPHIERMLAALGMDVMWTAGIKGIGGAGVLLRTKGTKITTKEMSW